MVTHWIFTALVLVLAAQRIVELRWSARNEAVIRSAGGREHAPWQLQAMKVLHTSWFLAMLLEVYVLQRPFLPALSLGALILVAAGQSLRYAAILSLRWRWTVNVMTLPGRPPVREGIYRYLRHPNYLGVILEILAVPLLHTAYITSIVFSVANLLLLRTRIQTEDRALLDAAASPPASNH